MENLAMRPSLTYQELSPKELDVAYAGSPDDPEILYQIGLGFYQSGKTEKSEKVFRRMVIVDPGSAKGFTSLGVIAWNRGDFEEAFQFFSRALEIDSSDPDTLVNLGLISEQLGEKELAISLLQAYLVICPNDEEIKARLEALRDCNGSCLDPDPNTRTACS